METLTELLSATPEFRRAIVAAVAISFAGAPLGVFLVLRRMSLSGDVYTHTLLPGVAVAFLLVGESTPALIVGGLVSGLIIACASALVARTTLLREDASLAAFYMISLAVGMVLLAGGNHGDAHDDDHGDEHGEAHGDEHGEAHGDEHGDAHGDDHGDAHGDDHGGAEELLHILFGDVFAIDGTSLLVISAVSVVTLISLAVIWRALVMESYDTAFFASVGGGGTIIHMMFIGLIILNLVIGATVLGTVMAVGLMTIPGACARFWSRDLGMMMMVAILIAGVSSLAGLLVAGHTGLPPGPAIILFTGVAYAGSIVFGRFGGLISRFNHRPHLES